ncbi:hypothetical protein N7490_006639 [Penicillium lividum]|nr:hypothetical protein N7490_006498 [Penicillium lividum]KAJ5642639.1 hypothetical protein N7490_006639 [Penicillium lividum]
MHWVLGTKFWVNARAKESLHSFLPSREDDRARDFATSMSTTRARPRGQSQSIRPQVDKLRCERCYGRRSAFYHGQHLKNSAKFPAVGICSRRRTLCAASKETSRNTLPVIHELAADEMVEI